MEIFCSLGAYVHRQYLGKSIPALCCCCRNQLILWVVHSWLPTTTSQEPAIITGPLHCHWWRFQLVQSVAPPWCAQFPQVHLLFYFEMCASCFLFVVVGFRVFDVSVFQLRSVWFVFLMTFFLKILNCIKTCSHSLTHVLLYMAIMGILFHTIQNLCHIL